MSDDLDLDELERLCAAADEEPWDRADGADDHCYCARGRAFPSAWFHGNNARNNLAFVQAARTALPALIALVRRLRQQTDERNAEVARLRADVAKSAVLRQAFNRAASTFPAGSALSGPMQEWWDALYQAIVSTAAGMALLAELQQARAEVARLQQQVAAHCERIAAASDVIAKNAERSPLARLEAWQNQFPESRVTWARTGRCLVLSLHDKATHDVPGRRWVMAIDRRPPTIPDMREDDPVVFVGTSEQPATLGECIDAALALWERMHGKDGAK